MIIKVSIYSILILTSINPNICSSQNQFRKTQINEPYESFDLKTALIKAAANDQSTPYLPRANEMAININKNHKWLLSLDGGGVRSIMQLQIIAEIERITKKSVIELFDSVAGTSTGGIIACLLTMPDSNNPSKPKYSAQDLLDIFTKRKADFFKTKKLSFWGLFKTRYKTTSLKNLLIDLLGKNKFSERLLPTVVVTHNLVTNEEQLISSTGDEDFFTWIIALASSPYPTYFKAQKVIPINAPRSHRGYTLSGGSTCMNNPTMAGIALLHNTFNSDADELNVLSIGSGASGTTRLNKKLQNGGILTWGFNIINTCIAGQESSTNKLAEFYCKDNYHRLNPILDQRNMKFDDISESNNDVLFAAARKCIQENKEEINEIIDKLNASNRNHKTRISISTTIG